MVNLTRVAKIGI